MRSAVVAALLAACAGDPSGPGGPSPLPRDPHAEPPAILRDVSMIADDATWNHPFVPGLRTTQDGRVALRIQGGPPGDERLATTLSFDLFVPERLAEPILPGPAGARILASDTPFDVVVPMALAEDVFVFGHHSICDATTEFPDDGERPNPQPCADTPDHDCYAITVISTISLGLGISAQLFGTPVTVEVAAPKTADARIVGVELGEPVAGTVLHAVNELAEPNVTADGRLLSGRYGRIPRYWTNPETGERLLRPYDLTYSLLPDDAEPCDVTGWTEFHPMSHAPFDPRMVGRYGLATYPFRDSEGQPIPDGEDMGGTYPWVDRAGTNVFMTGVHGKLSEQSETRYPRRCVVDGCERFGENRDWDRGFMVAGLWTHGKVVLLDGLVNNQDWAVGVAPQTHWWVDLYRASSGDPVAVRFGAGRFIDALRGGPHYPPGYTHNANILDSLQNLPNHAAAARPVTPRDVVWIVSSGVATDEIAFDDLLDPLALVVSNMQASVTQLYDRAGHSTAIPHHHNGQVRVLDTRLPIDPDYDLDPDADEEIHVQNAATSLLVRVPPYGLMEAGTGRIEPVALGGVHGRGLWLDGDNRVRYAMPAQDLGGRDLFVAVHVDPRTDEGASRALLTFPDGSSLRLVDRARVQYLAGRRVVHEVALPPSEGWLHLALSLRDDGREVTLRVDGFALDRLEVDEPLFGLVDGDLTLGRDGERDAGFRGWTDDLLVLAHGVDPEVACNHAGGTLIEVGADVDWRRVAERYPRWAHEEVAAAAGRDGGAYACFRDLRDDYAAHLANVPAGATSIRQAIHFPEGPLRAGHPRPDSSENPFCLSCHHEAGRGPLGLDALALRPDVHAEDDPRRQPSQPPRRVFGNVPAGWPNGAGPDVALRAPAEGLLVDRWLLAP